MEMKQNQIFFALDIFKSDTISFLSRNIKVFQWLSKSEFYSFMTKVNPNNGNETNQTFSLETYSNLTSYLFYEKMFKYFISLTFKIKISQFYDYRIPNNGNETKSDIFAWYIFRSDIIFQWSQNTKLFQWLLSLAFFNFIAKLSINK